MKKTSFEGLTHLSEYYFFFNPTSIDLSIFMNLFNSGTVHLDFGPLPQLKLSSGLLVSITYPSTHSLQVSSELNSFPTLI